MYSENVQVDVMSACKADALMPKRGWGRLTCSVLLFIFIALFVTYCVVFLPIHFHSSHRVEDSTTSDFHYGVIIDAGSSGTRLFIYTWPTHNGDPKELLHLSPLLGSDGRPVVKKITPGLSSFAENPEGAVEYMKPLLDLAVSSVPKNHHRGTPLFIMATAGMRMIPDEAQTAILTFLRREIKMNYSFHFADQNAAVISGKQEGVYGWIATNYLLGRFNHNHEDGVPILAVPSDHGHPHHRKRTVGVLDMGGGSMQIAYEVDRNSKLSGELAAEFNLGCRDGDAEHTYRIYVTTFLGYGANAARSRYEKYLIHQHNRTYTTTHLANTSSEYSNTTTMDLPSKPPTPSLYINDPCLPPGLGQKSQVAQHRYTFRGTGQFQECMDTMSAHLMGKEKECSSRPCSMAGRYQPPIDFKTAQFYGFSEFWYCTEDVLDVGGRYDFIKFYTTAKKYCSTSWLMLTSRYKTGRFKKVSDLTRLQMQCFKSAWIAAVLHSGFKFPRRYQQFQTVQEINGTEVQWTLGALLYHTRYFPLREVQRKTFLHMKRSRAKHLRGQHKYWILGCAVVFVLLVLGYTHGITVRRPRYFYRVVPPSNGQSNSKALLPVTVSTSSHVTTLYDQYHP